MVYYKCGKCGAVFTEEEARRSWGVIHCPHCGYEIVYKIARNYRLVKAI